MSQTSSMDIQDVKETSESSSYESMEYTLDSKSHNLKLSSPKKRKYDDLKDKEAENLEANP